MRIMFTSTSGWGHVNPMVPLARAFEARGDEVLWAVPPVAAARLEADGFAVRGVGPDALEPMPELLRRYPEIAALPGPERPDHLFTKIFGPRRTELMLPELQPVVDDWSPSLVVREAAEFAGPIAAARRDIPYVTHAFGALLPEIRVAKASEELAPLWRSAGLEPRPYGGSYDHLYLDIYPPGLQPQERPHVPATQHLRPAAVGSTSQSLPALVTEGSSRPLVYVTFGTVFNDMAPLRAVVDGARELDVRLVVTVGPEVDPLALGEQPPHVHVASYIPQGEVLRHCTAVVSHAGSGTFLAAVAAGLPQLCVPQGADQYLNAAACSQSGIGISLPQPVAPADVRAALERLLTDPSFAEAALRVSQDVAEMPSADEVADLLSRRYG